MASTSNFVSVTLTENDVPGAKLDTQDFGKYSNTQLNRWLQCRGLPVSGNRPNLLARMRIYVVILFYLLFSGILCFSVRKDEDLCSAFILFAGLRHSQFFSTKDDEELEMYLDMPYEYDDDEDQDQDQTCERDSGKEKKVMKAIKAFEKLSIHENEDERKKTNTIKSIEYRNSGKVAMAIKSIKKRINQKEDKIRELKNKLITTIKTNLETEKIVTKIIQAIEKRH